MFFKGLSSHHNKLQTLHLIQKMGESKTNQPTPGQLEIPEMHNFIIDPFDDDNFYTVKPPEDMMIDPFEKTLPPFGGMGKNSSEKNGTDDTGFQYREFHVTKVVMIPCLVLIVIFSLLLVYIIMRHLRAIMKLYMSVIFYAFSTLYFVILMLVLLVYNQVNILVMLQNSKKIIPVQQQVSLLVINEVGTQNIV